MGRGDGAAQSLRRHETAALLPCTADVIDQLSWIRFVTSGELMRTARLRNDPDVRRFADAMWQSAVKGVAFAWRLRVRTGDAGLQRRNLTVKSWSSHRAAL